MKNEGKIVYTVIGCMSGSDYSTDDAYVLGVFTDLHDALDCFEAEIDQKKKELTLKAAEQCMNMVKLFMNSLTLMKTVTVLLK